MTNDHVRVINGHSVYGFFKEVQGQLYTQLAQQICDGTIVEIGVHQGLSLSYILDVCRKNNNVVYAVDHWILDQSFQQRVRNPDNRFVFQHAWDRGKELPETPAQRDISGVFRENLEKLGHTDTVHIVQKESTAASQDFEDNYFDMIFIDGGHGKEDVTKDIQAWASKLKQGGIIAGHDYTPAWPGVVQAVHECFYHNPVVIQRGLWFVRKP